MNMQETQRIVSLFEKLYDGSPWIDVNLYETLSNLTAEQAAKRAIQNGNTIWEITNHLIAWRLNVLKRIQGELITTPSNNYFEPIENPINEQWKDTLKQLSTSQQQWLDFLNRFNENDFQKTYPNNQMSYYEHIHGILQHDCYHLGQIVFLAKLVK